MAAGMWRGRTNGAGTIVGAAFLDGGGDGAPVPLQNAVPAAPWAAALQTETRRTFAAFGDDDDDEGNWRPIGADLGGGPDTPEWRAAFVDAQRSDFQGRPSFLGGIEGVRSRESLAHKRAELDALHGLSTASSSLSTSDGGRDGATEAAAIGAASAVSSTAASSPAAVTAAEAPPSVDVEALFRGMGLGFADGHDATATATATSTATATASTISVVVVDATSASATEETEHVANGSSLSSDTRA